MPNLLEDRGVTNTQTALIAQTAGLALAGPIGSFDAYLDRVNKIPVLSREHEQGRSAPNRAKPEIRREPHAHRAHPSNRPQP